MTEHEPLSALPFVCVGPWVHAKSGAAVRVICVARVEANPNESIVVYVHDGVVWSRPTAEFLDRFEVVSPGDGIGAWT